MIVTLDNGFLVERFRRFFTDGGAIQLLRLFPPTSVVFISCHFFNANSLTAKFMRLGTGLHMLSHFSFKFRL